MPCKGTMFLPFPLFHYAKSVLRVPSEDIKLILGHIKKILCPEFHHIFLFFKYGYGFIQDIWEGCRTFGKRNCDLIIKILYMEKITVKESDIAILSINENDYISLTDIARHKSDEPFIVINNWMRNRNTIEYLGMWETIFNPDFKPIEFDRFKMEAGLNAFTLSPKKWIDSTNAIGILTRPGRYGGTFAHKDIAFKFAGWISVEFELYMVKEFQRLKEQDHARCGWTAKRELAKINYHIHTSAVGSTLFRKESLLIR